MKTAISKVLMLIALAFCLPLALTGCSGSDGGGALDGTFRLDTVTTTEQTLAADQLSQLGMSGEITFTGDTFKLDMFGENVEGTYKVEGTKLTLSPTTGDDSTPGEADINGDILTVSDGAGSTMTFKKVS